MPGDCAGGGGRGGGGLGGGGLRGWGGGGGGGGVGGWGGGGGGGVGGEGERVRPGSETGVWPWLHTGKYSCSEQGLLLAQTAERHSVQNLNCRRPCTL